MRGIVFIDLGDFGVGDRGNGNRGAVEQGVLDHAAFGHGELRLVLRQEGLERRVAGVGGRREGAGRNEGRLTAALFEEQRGIGLRHAERDARHLRDRRGELFDEELLAQVAAQLRLADAVLPQEVFEHRLVELARHAGESGQVGDAAVDQPLADAEAQLGRELVERRSFDELIEHLVEPARFDEGGHRQPGLVLPRLIIGLTHALAQFADADILAADLRDIGAADPAEGRVAGDVAERKGDPDKHDEGEREEFADRRGKHGANGGDHEAGILSGRARVRAIARCFRREAVRYQGWMGFCGVRHALPMSPARR